MPQSFHDAITVDNPAELLRNQDGTFEVVSPYGLVFQVTCQPGTTMKMREVPNSARKVEPLNPVWRIRRVSAPLIETSI